MSKLTITEPAIVDEAVRVFKEKAATATFFELTVLERDLWKCVKPYVLGPSHTYKTIWWDLTIGHRTATYQRALILQ